MGLIAQGRQRPRGYAGAGMASITVVLCLTLVAPAIRGQSQVSPEQIDAIKEQIEDIDGWLESARDDRTELEQALARSERKISDLKKESRSLARKETQQKQTIEALRQRINKLDRELEGQRGALAAQIRAAWMQGDAPALKVLLNEADPQKVARIMTYHEYLSDDALQRLNAFKRTQQTLQATRAQAITAQQTLQGTQAAISQRQQDLQTQNRTREQALAKLEASISDKQSAREKLVGDRERLEKLLREVEAAIASIPAPEEAQPIETQRGKLPWPARGKVITGFGESMHNGRLRHNGLLISTAKEAQVKAVYHGRVVFANWLRGFGLMTIIDHGNGYMSLYGRNSSLLKTPGDWVRAGDSVAIAGDSGRSPGYTLYFEVRRNGKPQDPVVWLSPRN